MKIPGTFVPKSRLPQKISFETKPSVLSCNFGAVLDTSAKDVSALAAVNTWCAAINFPGNGLLTQDTSAPSNLDFRVEGPEFAAGVVDFHLPVDAALRGVDIL